MSFGVMSDAMQAGLFSMLHVLMLTTLWGFMECCTVVCSTCCRWTPRSNRGVEELLLRSSFREAEFHCKDANKAHSHGRAAALRASASHFAEMFVNSVGYEPYFFQKSAQDHRLRRLGAHRIIDVKDVTTGHVNLHLQDKDICIFIDADANVDMNEFLAEHVNPVLLYCFQPSVAARGGTLVGGDYCFSWHHDGTVNYHVTGGATYNHPVWNYCQDSIKAVKYTFFGIPTRVVTYLVERRTVGPDRDIILIVPSGIFTGFQAIKYQWLIGSPLKRLNPVVGEWVRLETLSCEEGRPAHTISTSRVGDYMCATIPADVDNGFSVMVNQPGGLTSGHVKRAAETYHFTVDDTVCALLRAYHNQHNGRAIARVTPVQYNYRRYQIGLKQWEADAQPSMDTFMNPLYPPAYAPDKTKGNTEAAVAGRIEKVKPKVGPRSFFLERVMLEFIERLIPEKDKWCGHIVDEEEVFVRQNRPSQRSILSKAFSMTRRTVNAVLKVFIKTEAYGKATDPRLISTLDPIDKVDYATVQYPLSDYLKTQRWYAFGKTPRETAEAVSLVCMRCRDYVGLTDFSRFDGRVSEHVRYLEQLVLMRYFAPKYHAWIREIHQRQFNCSAFAPFDVTYQSGTARASGSPETSVFNSVVNAFVAYYALRKTKGNAGFYSPAEAWSRLGIYGGDDGMTADVQPDVYQAAASAVGQVITYDMVLKGQLGVKFLARVYSPNVFFGCLDSCCDLPRQLAKFHMTGRLPESVTPARKLYEKALSFQATDANTPIIGPVVNAAVYFNTERIGKRMPELRRYDAVDNVDDQYPNVRSQWMVTYAAQSLPKLNFEAFYLWLNSCRNTDDLLAASEFFVDDLVDKPDFVINNDIHFEPLSRRLQQPRRLRPRKIWKPSPHLTKEVPLSDEHPDVVQDDSKEPSPHH
jgi:hypothetical protein